MKVLIASVLLVAPLALHAQGTPQTNTQVLLQSDFEESMATVGRPPVILSHEDAKPRRVVADEIEAAKGASGDSTAAMLIAGGGAEPHSWKPAADFSFDPQSKGTMTISFAVRNVSLDAGTLGVQVAHKEGNYYQAYQSLTVYSDHIKVSGTGRHLFKGITAGADSLWHKIEWSFPLPGSAGGNPLLSVDGADQGSIKFEPNSPAETVNNVRFWLPTKRGEDIQFLIDDIKIEVASD